MKYPDDKMWIGTCLLKNVDISKYLVALLICIMITPVSLLANPLGEQVMSGSAAFNRSGNSLTVTQGSERAIINWQNFSISHGQTTSFVQPGIASAILNRVVSKNPSEIYGTLNANGKVYLINQNGILVGPGG